MPKQSRGLPYGYFHGNLLCSYHEGYEDQCYQTAQFKVWGWGSAKNDWGGVLACEEHLWEIVDQESKS